MASGKAYLAWADALKSCSTASVWRIEVVVGFLGIAFVCKRQKKTCQEAGFFEQASLLI
ncbi:MAG: hypothetical protein RPR40_00910 [Bermanella sp.]